MCLIEENDRVNSVNNSSRYVIGIDIGGTNTKFGIVNSEGVIMVQGSMSTTGYPVFGDYVEQVCLELEKMIGKCGLEGHIQAVGIGAPNANFHEGTIESAPNLEWKGVVPLAKTFSVRLGLPVRVSNDANAAALGEMLYGTARGMGNFIVLTLGTGVGGGVVANGKLVSGHDGLAGELGHVIIDNSPDARVCGCGRAGCLEAYCSASGIARTADMMLAYTDTPSLLRNIEAPLSAEDIFLAAEQDDKIAKDIFEYTGNILGKALANFIAILNPEAIIIFGGVSKAGGYLLEPVRRAIDDNVLPILKGKTQLLVSTLKDSDAAILGASAIAW
ncbi:MAG TPA: ROK family protein [Bacteroidaceae bacterium]|nr:ROK family protein [Bacteroidaceae bacterium]